MSLIAFWLALEVGLTQSGQVISAESLPGPIGTAKVLLIGGLSGAADAEVVEEVSRFRKLPAGLRKVQLLAIANANPDGSKLQFPPQGPAYTTNAEAHALWRWIQVQAPDLVIVAGPDPYGLSQALPNGRQVASVRGLLNRLGPVARSAAAREMETRMSRSPLEVAKQLERVYGHSFDEAVYIPAMALIGRMRLGREADVRRLVAPFAEGKKDSLAKATASHLSGHLVFAALAESTGEQRYIDAVRRAAESLPFHNEMSDSVFMVCPIQAKAGKLTQDSRYFDIALRHFRLMQKLCLRADGLYRHSPLAEAAWGRGNAFPLLGLALTLADVPKEHAAHREMLAAYQKLSQALAKHQDASGMWRQVVDHAGAYPEYSATAMIGRALLIGLKHGWIQRKTYQPKVDAAWRAVSARTSADGVLMDVCESTGKQSSLAAYLQRTAIFDRDPRGGGMALLFATEMANLK